MQTISEKFLRQIVRKSIIKEKLRGAFKPPSIRDLVGKKSSDQVGLGDLKGFEFQSIPNKTAVENAKKELEFWENGSRKDNKNDKETNDKLNTYWSSANYNFKGNPWDEPWSAAFISHVMNDSNFKSAAHTSWATKALQNRNDMIKDPQKYLNKEAYILFGSTEGLDPVEGDVPFRLRDGGDIGEWVSKGGGTSPSHSDVFIGNNKVIGGNLSDSVKESSYDHPTLIKRVKITKVPDSKKS
jgi:hypothetical protein